MGVLAAMAAAAHEPITTKLTWTQEISRIFYKRCVSCHREGGSAPMGLATYKDARPWAKAIRDEVLARRMPPWDAVKGVGEFRDDPSLSQPEIDMIASWVEGGAPEGNAAYLPALSSMWAAPARRSGDTVPQRDELVLRRGAPMVLRRAEALVGLRAEGVAEGGWMEVLAQRPDGSIERLIWIRGFRQAWNRAYEFLAPVRLPRGTRVVVHSGDPARAAIAVASPAR
jgi:mono/diheme cytochrome c family protein